MLLLVVLALPFSGAGSRLLIEQLSSHSPLELSYHSGRLVDDLRLESLALNSDGVEIELRDVQLRLNPNCLLQAFVCVRKLRVAEARIAVLESAQKGDEQPSEHETPDNSRLLLPLKVLAPHVVLKQLQLSWPGGAWSQQRAELALEVNATGIYITEATIQQPLLELDASADESSVPGRIELPELWLPIELAVDKLQLIQPGWNIGGETMQVDQMSLSGRWRDDRLELARLALNHSDWGLFRLRGLLSFTGDWPLSFALQGSAAQSLPWPLLAGRQLALEVRGDLAELALNLRSAGTWPLQLDGQVDVLDPQLPFRLAGRVESKQPLVLSEHITVPDSAPAVEIILPLSLSAEGSLDSQSLQASLAFNAAGYEAMQVELKLRHQDQRLEIERLSLQEPGEEGSGLAAEGSLIYGESLALQLGLDSSGFSLPAFSDYLFGRLAGHLDLTLQSDADAWSLNLSALQLAGSVNALPASAQGHVAVDSDSRLSGDLSFDINGAKGSLRGRPEARAADIKLHLSDLGRWLRGSRGSMELQASLARADAQLLFSAELDDLAWQDWQMESAELSGQASLQDLDRFEAAMTLRSVSQGSLFLDQVELLLKADQQQRSLRLVSTGDIATKLQASARRSAQQWQGWLEPTLVDSPAGQWHLEQAVAFTIDQSVATVADHCWQSTANRLCVKQTLLGAQGALQVVLDGDLSLLAPLAIEEVDLSGQLSAVASVNWGGDQGLQGSAELHLREGLITQPLGQGEFASWRWDELEAQALYQSSELQVQLALQRDARQILKLNAVLPPDPQQTLRGELRLEGLDLAALRPFVPSLSRLEGSLHGGWTLQGTVDEPRAIGHLQWRNGLVALATSPSELSELTVDIDLRGSDVLLEGSGLLGGGQVSLKGQLETRPDWALNLKLQGQNNRLLYPPSVEVVVSPDLSIKAREGLVDLKGRVRVDRGEVQQAELPEGSIDVSSDVVQVDYAGNEIQGDKPFATRIDVRVMIAERFKISGGGLEATVGGELQLQQEPSRPLQLYGNLKVLGGEYRAYGQRLEIKQGRISFAGDPENPELDLSAQREIPLEKVTAGVRVTGTLEQPTLDVYSDPAKSQAEALSYLIRGRGLDAGAGTDGTALALSLGTGIVNRSKVVEGLNSLPGLSHVEFGAEGSDDETAATVSGYIGERIYLSYGVGLYEPVNVLTARLYLQTRLWLEVVSRLESSVDLYYSFDID